MGKIKEYYMEEMEKMKYDHKLSKKAIKVLTEVLRSQIKSLSSIRGRILKTPSMSHTVNRLRKNITELVETLEEINKL